MNAKTAKGLFGNEKAEMRGASLAESDVTLQMEDRIDPGHARHGLSKHALYVATMQPQPKDDYQQTVMSPTNWAEAPTKSYHNITFCANPKDCQQC